ncbi:MupA/Atu3671 family FMN-dependent luciferase-like monooxygenase [Acanthopleuribacter pedis]|uniref:LLM class flavin-dependent oxidoreductase n=1 Tax=Acanthopleuribacter pedis TaxID=442870 RepID=A0A8J7Q4N9_9BACT|nr:MupA/Atu3671 family FMN-dependent luciferase-like monooxygenase [Acanthopleuribacter pedis]MBO1318069.1 LLM class flavin-dependent oxidoreductase [Acanthopleuribacter pedis]
MDLQERLRRLSPEQQRRLSAKLEAKNQETHADSVQMDFSLFFFAADGRDAGKTPYDLLMETARFGDAHGFSAIWTPERHFGDFGGLYPNPTVLAAALAMVTQNLQLRAGSLVLPLHHPVRVAEDWSVIDNLSGGRAAVSFATGWHRDDYVINPDQFHDRNAAMFRNIALVRRLWAGETVSLPGVDGETTRVATLPRPRQAELPVWITATSPTTWERAGAVGANILTALIALEPNQLAERVALYREARAKNGHDPRTGVVSLMLHTYVGEDREAVRQLVRAPMKRYLAQYLDQFRAMGAFGEADHDEETLLEFAFERYFRDRALLGTRADCAAMVRRMHAAGVNEIACLLDFGLDDTRVLAGLEALNAVRSRFATRAGKKVQPAAV